MARRAWSESTHDNIGLIAAGVGFYGFLALVPLLGATVLTYGLFADAGDVARHVAALFSVLPRDAAQLISSMLDTVVKTSSGKKGFGLVLALVLALYGARNAAGAIITALNVAFEVEETRSLVRVTVLALAITVAAVASFVVGAAALAAVRYINLALPSDGIAGIASKAASSLVLALLAGTGAALLYRFGPAGQDRPWRWITPGSLLFAVTWVALTAGFGFYVAHFGNYGATYGSLGAVVVLLTWLYLSAYALLFGAELNSQVGKPATPAAGGTVTAKPADRAGRLPLRARLARGQIKLEERLGHS